MKISEIIWDDDTIAHIARHAVTPQEVEDICFKERPFTLRARVNRYLALGQTEGGRYLTIILEPAGSQRAKVITARAMSEAEQRIYKRR